MMIGVDTEFTVIFVRDILGRTLPSAYRWKKSERRFSKELAWGVRHVGVTIFQRGHAGPTGIAIAAMLRYHALEEWIWERRDPNPSLLSKREVARWRRHGLTLAVPSVASSGRQWSLDLPNDDAWLSKELEELGRCALTWLEAFGTPEAAEEVLLAKESTDEHTFMQQIAIHSWRGELGEVERAMDVILGPESDYSADLQYFARKCRELARQAPEDTGGPGASG